MGTQLATVLLGCPPLRDETRLFAALSDSLLTGAALCAELVAAVQEQDHADPDADPRR